MQGHSAAKAAAQQQQIEKEKLDYHLVRALKCAELYKTGFMLHPDSTLGSTLCSDVVSIDVYRKSQGLSPVALPASSAPSGSQASVPSRDSEQQESRPQKPLPPLPPSLQPQSPPQESATQTPEPSPAQSPSAAEPQPSQSTGGLTSRSIVSCCAWMFLFSCSICFCSFLAASRALWSTPCGGFGVWVASLADAGGLAAGEREPEDRLLN